MSARRVRGRFARQLFVMFVACALIPLAALSLLTWWNTSGHLRDEVEGSLEQSCRFVGVAVAERLATLEADLGLLLAGLRDAQRDSLSRAMDVHRERFENRFRGFAMYGPGGVLLSVDGDPPPPPGLEADDERHLEEGRTLLRTVVQAGSEPTILMLRQATVQSAGLDSLAVRLVAEVDAFWLWEGESALALDAELCVFDADNRLLFASTPTAPEWQKSAQSADAGLVEWRDGDRTYLGRQRTLFLQPRYRTHWGLLYSRAQTEVLAPLQQFQLTFLFIALFAFLGASLLSLVQIRRRLRPVRDLVDATRMVAGNHLDVAVHIDSGDEFETLGRAFNHMVRRLADQQNARDRAESELRAARDDALAAARREAEFVANVSHELRTPMTSIRAFAEILAEHREEEQHTREEFLSIILMESDRLSRLIEQVLDFSKMSSGLVSLRLEEIDVARSIEDACAALAGMAAQCRVALDYSEVPAPLPAVADPDRIAQVWTNLLSNAIKFSPRGGTVRVRARCEVDDVVVEVVDHGPGIHPEHHFAVFERFRQVGDQLTDKPVGTGLGLTIAQEIIRQHGGSISVDSAPGQGATFRVRLPVVPEVACLEVEKAPVTMVMAADGGA